MLQEYKILISWERRVSPNRCGDHDILILISLYTDRHQNLPSKVGKSYQNTQNINNLPSPVFIKACSLSLLWNSTCLEHHIIQSSFYKKFAMYKCAYLYMNSILIMLCHDLDYRINSTIDADCYDWRCRCQKYVSTRITNHSISHVHNFDNKGCVSWNRYLISQQI